MAKAPKLNDKFQRDSIRRHKDRIVKKFVSQSKVKVVRIAREETDAKRRALVKKMTKR